MSMQHNNNTVQTKKMILVISHVIPYPPSAGNEIRIMNMMKWLQDKGFGIVFLFNHETVSNERRKVLDLLFEKVHFINDNYGDELSKHFVNKNFKKKVIREVKNLFKMLAPHLFSKILISSKIKQRFASDRLIQLTKILYTQYKPFAVLTEYIFTTPCFKVIPEGVLKIVDTHDMFSRKKKEVLKYGINDTLYCKEKEERYFLLQADIVIAIQSHEACLFKKLVPERTVITVGIDFNVSNNINHSTIPGNVLVVGSDNKLNIHGFYEFYKQAWPKIKEACPWAILSIVGKLSNNVNAKDQDIRLIGWTDNLDQEYNQAAVVINPTVAGTGLKIKSVEAICRGKALVSTPNGIEGINSMDEGYPYIVANNWKSFANEVINLIKSDDKRIIMQQRAMIYAKEHFVSEKVYEQLKYVLQF
jgi:glycosyltransferase involved in cell wall biosynthesis